MSKLMTDSMPVSFPVGTLLRAPDGVEFTVEDYISAELAEDGIAFYWGSNRGGINNVNYLADGLTVVKTAAELEARVPPTATELASSIDLGTSIGFSIDGTDPGDEPGTIFVYGTTADGLAISFTVRISNIERAEL
jgi:hypothetical protein